MIKMKTKWFLVICELCGGELYEGELCEGELCEGEFSECELHGDELNVRGEQQLTLKFLIWIFMPVLWKLLRGNTSTNHQLIIAINHSFNLYLIQSI